MDTDTNDDLEKYKFRICNFCGIKYKIKSDQIYNHKSHLIGSQGKRNHRIVAGVQMHALCITNLKRGREIPFVLEHLEFHTTSFVLNAQMSVSPDIKLVDFESR